MSLLSLRAFVAYERVKPNNESHLN